MKKLTKRLKTLLRVFFDFPSLCKELTENREQMEFWFAEQDRLFTEAMKAPNYQEFQLKEAQHKLALRRMRHALEEWEEIWP